ncbi:MAG: hypothetical protein B6I28_06455 [Fusobacteriia bacterium 4572_132]|nr:MAG: hypothetical protein B6I28_06455 [Fusobacteriia bacterium 4572_132]
MKIKNDYSFKITVLGTGATGSNFVSMLTQIYSNFIEEIESVLLIDGDKFEEKNLRNQKCLLSDVNINKAKVLCERYKRVYPNLKIAYYDKYIKDSKEFKKILSNRKFLNELDYANNRVINLIIGTVDNDKTRTIIDETIKEFKKDKVEYIYIDSGNDTDNMSGQVYLNYHLEKYSINSNSLEDNEKIESFFSNKLLTEIYPDILESKNEDIEKLIGCSIEVNEKPQLLPTNLMAANLITQLFYKVVINKEIPNNHLFVFDANNLSSTFVRI